MSISYTRDPPKLQAALNLHALLRKTCPNGNLGRLWALQLCSASSCPHA